MEEALRIKDIMAAYLVEGMTHEKFANALNESLRNTGVTRTAITNWSNDRAEPNTDFLLICMTAYSDWRREWALECLKVKLPEIFDSGIVKFQLPVAG
jgi:hypothetical protein